MAMLKTKVIFSRVKGFFGIKKIICFETELSVGGKIIALLCTYPDQGSSKMEVDDDVLLKFLKEKV